MIPSHPFGATGLRVPALGFGAGHIGEPAMDEAAVGELLHGALDMGCTLIDTAPSYGLSEERIGRHLAARRDDFLLSTKVGYGVPGVDDWTGPCVARGIDAALSRLRTDRVDIVHLHSCSTDVLRRDDVLEALAVARRAGKLRVAAYSGDGEPLRYAVESGCFQSVQVSLSLCDQAAIALLPLRGLGVIAKRPLSNAVWRFSEPPEREDLAIYHRRWRALALEHDDPLALALRFTAFTPGVHVALVGTARLAHLCVCAAALAQGPLDPALRERIRSAFLSAGDGWHGVV